jgi:mono/diheme cytochrome c family protein
MRGRRASALAVAFVGIAALASAAVRGQASAQPSANASPPVQPTAKPQPGTASQLQRGKAVFDQWCAACHAPGPRHPGTQALDALYKGSKPGALEQRTDLVPKLTETFVRKGVSVMAPYRKTEISDADLAALAAYLAPKTP